MRDREEEHEMSPDEIEVRRVHREWWISNHGLDIARMRACFAPDYLMWNLNTHPYYGLDEKVALFGHYRAHMVPTEPVELWDVEVTVGADMAYVASQGVLPVVIASGEGSGSVLMDAAAPHYERRGDTIRFRFRETTVLRRADDGAWRIWHFHCSASAPEREPRPGFGDTAAARGLRGPVEVMADLDDTNAT